MSNNVVDDEMALIRQTAAVEQLLTKRQMGFSYLKRFHNEHIMMDRNRIEELIVPTEDMGESKPGADSDTQGDKEKGRHWMNICKIENMDGLYSAAIRPNTLQHKITLLLALGQSTSKLLLLPTGAQVLIALDQLLTEYDDCNESRGIHPVLWANTSVKGSEMVQLVSMLPSKGFILIGLYESFSYVFKHDVLYSKGIIHRVNKRTVYYFMQRPILYTMDSISYTHCIYALCEVFHLIYNKFRDFSCQNVNALEAVRRIDDRVKTMIVTPLCDDVSAITRPIIESEFNSLQQELCQARINV